MRKKLFCLLLVLFVSIISAISVNAVLAAESQNDVNYTENYSESEIANRSTSVDAPTVIWDNSQYNMIVRYDWRVGRGGDDLYKSSNWQYYLSVGDVLHRTYEFPDRETAYCAPDYFIYKSYSTPTDTFSDTTSLEHEIDMGTYVKVVYGYDCRYTAVGVFPYWKYSQENSIATSYDQTDHIWDHNSSNGHYIKATIEYQGVLSDIEVKIPWIGYRTSQVTINGVTFYLRTGPNRCSIKAGQSNVPANQVKFMFGIE